LESDVRNRGEVQAWPAGAGGVDVLVAGAVVDDVLVGGLVVVDVLVAGCVVVLVTGAVVDEVLVGGCVVVLVTGAVLDEVAGSVVGATLSQVTLTTVRLIRVWSRLRPSHPTACVAPAETAIAPAGTAAAGSGTTDSRPDTAARTCDPVQVRGAVTPAEAGTIT